LEKKYWNHAPSQTPRLKERDEASKYLLPVAADKNKTDSFTIQKADSFTIQESGNKQ
jgi:hypothetical protein